MFFFTDISSIRNFRFWVGRRRQIYELKKSPQVILANSAPVENLWIKTPFHCFKCHKVIINSLSSEAETWRGKKSREHLAESWLLCVQILGIVKMHFENTIEGAGDSWEIPSV